MLTHLIYLIWTWIKFKMRGGSVDYIAATNRRILRIAHQHSMELAAFDFELAVLPAPSGCQKLLVAPVPAKIRTISWVYSQPEFTANPPLTLPGTNVVRFKEGRAAWAVAYRLRAADTHSNSGSEVDERGSSVEMPRATPTDVAAIRRRMVDPAHFNPKTCIKPAIRP